MDCEPEQLNLGALGFAGICRQTCRVLLTAVLPSKDGWRAALLSALLLANIAVYRAFLSLLDAAPAYVSDPLLGAGLSFAYGFSNAVCVFSIIAICLPCTAGYVVRVAALYCGTDDGDSGAPDPIIREDLPRVPLLFFQVLPFAIIYIASSAITWLELPQQLDTSVDIVILALQLLGGAALLAGAAYVAVVSHIACVVAVLEGAVSFDAVHKSRALLVGKSWAAAAVFVPLDACFVALQVYFPDFVLEDALSLGRGFQVATGAAMAVALSAVVAATLVAQPVVYLVCKSHHHEKVHLN